MTDNPQSGCAGPWNYLRIWALSSRESVHLIVCGLCDPTRLEKPSVLRIWLKWACSTVQKWHSRVVFVLLMATSWASALLHQRVVLWPGLSFPASFVKHFALAGVYLNQHYPLYPPPRLVSGQKAAQSAPDMLVTSDTEHVDVELDRGLQHIYWLRGTVFHLFS